MWFDVGERTVTLVPGTVADYSATTQLLTIESAALDGNVSLTSRTKIYSLQLLNCHLKSTVSYLQD